MKKQRYRLRDLDVTRVDLVDRGANQLADIKLAKADTQSKPDLASRIKQFMEGKGGDQKPGGDQKQPDGHPILRDKGSGSRIVRLNPADFEVVNQSKNMMEWAIPEDKLPEGVEEAMITMVQSDEAPMFQWLIDPLAGPPVEGQSKTAAEAFMAMRGALTTQGAMDPTAMLGGLPGQMQQQPGAGAGAQAKPQAKPQAQQKPNPQQKKKPSLAKAAKLAKAADQRLNTTLDLIAKGLVEVNVFADTATGEDLRDILPDNLLGKIRNELSAESAE